MYWSSFTTKINTVLFLKLFNFHNILLYAVRPYFFLPLNKQPFPLVEQRQFLKLLFKNRILGGEGKFSLLFSTCREKKTTPESVSDLQPDEENAQNLVGLTSVLKPSSAPEQIRTAAALSVFFTNDCLNTEGFYFPNTIPLLWWLFFPRMWDMVLSNQPETQQLYGLLWLYEMQKFYPLSFQI